MEFEYWYLAPIALSIATVAMASGIGGAVFFAPLFILGLKLEPTVAVGSALITELFGFTSGIYAYWRRGLIDFKLGLNLLIFSVPAAIVGSLTADDLPGDVLKTIFAVGIIFIGLQLYQSYRQEQKDNLERVIAAEAEIAFESELTATDGTVYRYSVCERHQGRLLAAIGGAFVGMISVGLAELQEYQLVARCRVPPPVAVGTSIFVVVVTVLFASLGHVYHFTRAADPALLEQVQAVITFTIPGVVVGGELGPWLQSRVDPDVMQVSIAFLFMAVGGFMLFTMAS